MPGKAAKITVTERQHEILLTLRNAITAPSALTHLTVTDFGGLDVGIPQAMRRSIDFAANSHGIGAG